MSQKEGMKLGQGSAKNRVLGVFRDEQGSMYFKVADRADPVPHEQLLEDDPMALVLYYEASIKLLTLDSDR